MLDNKLFDLAQNYPTYQPTPDESKRLGRVKQRIAAMQSARTVVDKDRGLYQQMIDAIWIPYPDERSSSTVPLASSIIELAVAEATKIKTEYNFTPESSKYLANTRAFEYVWKHLWRKNGWEKVTDKAEYIAFGFGNVPLYVGYESYGKVQSDAIVDPETGEVSREEHEIKKEGIVLKLGDIRQFYIDNQAVDGIDDADDCAYRQRQSFDQFKELASNPLYKNIDKVVPRGYSNDWKTFITQEEAVKAGDYVERWFYWNVRKDCYIEIANDVEVREHPMMSTIDGEKALPWVWRGLGHKNYSIYNRGICEALMMFNSEINNLREMLMDGIRRSNSQVLAIGNGLKFNGRGFSYDNQILTFDGKLGNDNFQQISGTPPNQAIFEYVQQLYKDISVFIGIDIQNVMGEPDLTAYQTEVKRESSMKRMNVWLRNRDESYQRLANLLKDQILTWFPVKDAQGMAPELETEGVEITQTPEGQPDKIKKKKGTSSFQVTPEILRNGKRQCEASTNTGAPTIGAVDRKQKEEFLTALGPMAQNIMLAKQAGLDVETVLPIKDTIRDLAESYGITPIDNTGNNEELDAAKNDFMQKLMAMKQGMNPQPQQPGQEPGAMVGGTVAQPQQAQGQAPLPNQPALTSNPQGGAMPPMGM